MTFGQGKRNTLFRKSKCLKKITPIMITPTKACEPNVFPSFWFSVHIFSKKTNTPVATWLLFPCNFIPYHVFACEHVCNSNQMTGKLRLNVFVIKIKSRNHAFPFFGSRHIYLQGPCQCIVHIYIHIYIYMYVCMYLCMCVCMCVCVYIFIKRYRYF